ncbi:MAG: Ig-like domain-containing protein [SAR324 cluster bacterium]|nr:Ig-like domain-containing protein [SAR324 cluster bacterium]MBL7035368.1 Ig-like domain-containing protein [SAR324 cluster bacterium]
MSVVLTPFILPLLFLFLNSCGIERSEYGKKSDYQKLGAGCTASSDTTKPSVSAVSPTDNSTGNAVTSTVAFTFSEAMFTDSLSTNTSDTTCSGSFQLSADNFSTCIKMSAAPSVSNSDKTFTSTPADNLSSGTTYQLRATTSVTDSSCNKLASAYTSNGFTTSTSGSGTIKGSIISQSGSSALSDVSISYALSATTVASTSSDSSGDYTQSSLATGTYILTYSKSGYLDETQTATLSSDGQTLKVSSLKMLSSSCATSGTISGNITDAVSSANVSSVSMSFRRGLNTTSGTADYTATTDGSGNYSLSMNRGWYTAQTSKSGYIDSTFHVYSCGNVSSQDSSISTTLASGAMRIVLSWPTGSTATDIDSHFSIPDNSSATFHIYYDTNVSGVNHKKYIYGASDNTTLDRDETSAPGTETITVTAVRSGNYSYSIHDYTNKASSSISKLANSGASVKVYYNSTITTYNAPNSAGTLWRVFTFTTSGGLVEVGTMSYQTTPADVY